MTSPPIVNSVNTDIFAKPSIRMERRPGGTILLRSTAELGPIERCLGAYLLRWAAQRPQTTFLAQRDTAGAWRHVTYGQALAAVRSIAQALLDRGLSVERPVLILSDNSIDHALVALAAMHVGIPVVPISPAYSRMSQDLGKVRYIARLVNPGLIFADSGTTYGRALAAVMEAGEEGEKAGKAAEIVVSTDPPEGGRIALLAELLATRPTAAVSTAHEAITPDSIAKILFTSGSTALPKGVINTHRMMCSNQASIAGCWPFLERQPPVLLDWLPWNHTFGGNHNFNMVLCNGGTLYIDDGKPAPGLVEKTLANLREVSPTAYFNVPRGYAMLMGPLDADRDLAKRFLGNLAFLFYAGAALPQSLWTRIEALSESVLGRRVPLISSWGATETAPMVTSVHFALDRAGNIGVPAPGSEVKLVPDGDKLEIRVRGPNVTPGYVRRPDLTEEAFDEEGFYRTGDAVVLANPDDPNAGIVFDGRIGENFKLSSGTWVNVGALRVAAIAAGAPVIEDLVVTGHDRDDVGILIFPSLAGCRSLCPELGKNAPLTALVQDARVRGAVREALRTLALHGTSSTRVTRALLMTEGPSIDANEITDKGYLNQRAVLTRRAALVGRLYGETGDPDVIRLDP